MEGETKVFDLSLFLPLLCMLKEPAGLDHTALTIESVIKLGVQDVQQIVVYIIGAEVLQLLCEDTFDLVFCLYCKGRELGCFS